MWEVRSCALHLVRLLTKLVRGLLAIVEHALHSSLRRRPVSMCLVKGKVLIIEDVRVQVLLQLPQRILAIKGWLDLGRQLRAVVGPVRVCSPVIRLNLELLLAIDRSILLDTWVSNRMTDI